MNKLGQCEVGKHSRFSFLLAFMYAMHDVSEYNIKCGSNQNVICVKTVTVH